MSGQSDQPTGGRRIAAVFGLAALVIVLFALAPLISALTAGAVAQYGGCQLDEGGVHPCVIAGADYGETLSVMFVAGWLMFVTFPIGLGAGLIWLIALSIILISRSRRRRGRPSADQNT